MGLESMFITSSDECEMWGDIGDVIFFNVDTAPLELTEYAKELLKQHKVTAPVTDLCISVSQSVVAFYCDEIVVLRLPIQITCVPSNKEI